MSSDLIICCWFFFFFLSLSWKQGDFSQLHSSGGKTRCTAEAEAPGSRSFVLPQTRRPVREFQEQAQRGWVPLRDSSDPLARRGDSFLKNEVQEVVLLGAQQGPHLYLQQLDGLRVLLMCGHDQGLKQQE